MTSNDVLHDIDFSRIARCCGRNRFSCGQGRHDCDGHSTFRGGNENIAITLSILDAIDPSIVYLGSYLRSGRGAVPTPSGEMISGTETRKGGRGTVSSNLATIFFYDVKAGHHSDLIQLKTQAGTVGWTTDWSNLRVGKGMRVGKGKGRIQKVSSIAVFGETAAPTSVPEPASVALLSAGLFGLGLIRRRPRESADNPRGGSGSVATPA